MAAYHDVMEDNEEMLAQSKIGSRVVAGGVRVAALTLSRQALS